MSRQALILLAVAVVAALGGYLAAMRFADGPGRGAAAAVSSAESAAAERTGAGTLLGQRRPDFELQAADGRPLRAADFDGRPLLLNFWATWCKPCVEELPMLQQLRDDHAAQGLQVVGIAVDEPERARAFAEELGLDFSLAFGAGEAMLAGRRYGNASGMLPYSVLVDAGGIVRWTHLGALNRVQLEQQLAELY